MCLLTCLTGNWLDYPSGTLSASPGASQSFTYTTGVPPNTYVIVTPLAAGITFTPPFINLTSTSSSGTFSISSSAAGIVADVITTISGPDALFYAPVQPYSIEVSFSKTATFLLFANLIHIEQHPSIRPNLAPFLLM